MLTLGEAIVLLSDQVGAGRDPGKEINLVCERLIKQNDCIGSLELVTFTVTADANGEGFITMPDRYSAIRGAVTTTIADSRCARPLEIRNGWYEYAPGNLGMLKGSDGLRGIIPIPMAEGDTNRKYKVPVCPTAGSLAYFTCVCKRAFLFLEDDDDVLPVQNVAAIEKGLNARKKAYAEDYQRESQLWNEANTRLSEENDNATGSEALGKVQFDDDFSIGCLGGGEGWGYGGGYGGGWY